VSGKRIISGNEGRRMVMRCKGEEALEVFRGGFNCSQAIISTYGGEYGLERDTAIKVAAAFGGGIGRLGEVCGAATGALMVIGLKYGTLDAKDKAAKEHTYERTRAFVARFRSLNGSLLCRELLGCDIATPEGMEMARQKGCFTELCPRFVRAAAEILEEIL
jgi:C_GCAxxG_C_C family probable redox protein